jgi:hypothetical protein
LAEPGGEPRLAVPLFERNWSRSIKKSKGTAWGWWLRVPLNSGRLLWVDREQKEIELGRY